MITLFVDGLVSQELKERIFRKGVNTLKEAVDIAKSEHLAFKRFARENKKDLKKEKTLESYHLREKIACYNCDGPHKVRFCPEKNRSKRYTVFRRGKRPKRVNTLQQSSQRTHLSRKDKYCQEKDQRQNVSYGQHSRENWRVNPIKTENQPRRELNFNKPWREQKSGRENDKSRYDRSQKENLDWEKRKRDYTRIPSSQNAEKNASGKVFKIN